MPKVPGRLIGKTVAPPTLPWIFQCSQTVLMYTRRPPKQPSSRVTSLNMLFLSSVQSTGSLTHQQWTGSVASEWLGHGASNGVDMLWHVSLAKPCLDVILETLELCIPREPVQKEDILENQFPWDPSVELPGVPKVYTSWTRERAKMSRTSWNPEVWEKEKPARIWHGMKMNEPGCFLSNEASGPRLSSSQLPRQSAGASLHDQLQRLVCFLHCSHRRTLSLCKWLKCPRPMVHEVKVIWNLKPCKSTLQVQTSSMNHATVWSQNLTHSHSLCQRSPTINNRGGIVRFCCVHVCQFWWSCHPHPLTGGGPPKM